MEELKTKGNLFFKEGKYEQAIAEYTKALTLQGENATLFSNRSAAFSKVGKFQEALDDAEKCISYSRGWSKGFLRKVIALEGNNDLPKAMEAAEDGFKSSEGEPAMKKEFVRKWFSANQKLNKLPPEVKLDLPPGIYILSQAYFDVLMRLLRSLSGEVPLNKDTAHQCFIACATQIEDVLKCFGEPTSPHINTWATNLSVEIYPYNVKPSQKEEMVELVLQQTSDAVSFLVSSVDSTLYPLLRPILGLIVLVVLNRSNTLTFANAGHYDVELINRALIPFFESQLLNTDEYRSLHIGRICAILDSFVGRLYVLDLPERAIVKLYCAKLQKAVEDYPKDLSDYFKIREQADQVMHNITNFVLGSGQHTPEFKVDKEQANKSFATLMAIEHLTMDEVNELISLTGTLIKLDDYDSAMKCFKRGEEEFFNLLGKLLEMKVLKVDHCSTTIALTRQIVFHNAEKLSNSINYIDTVFRWKCLFTLMRSMFIHQGLGRSLSEFFLEYIKGLTDPSIANDDNLVKCLQVQIEKEEALLQAVAKDVLSSIRECTYERVLEALGTEAILVNYLFVPQESSDESMMKAFCMIVQNGNEPLICELDYLSIRRQVAMVVDVMTKTRKLLWDGKRLLYPEKVKFELEMLAELIIPECLKEKLLAGISHLYVSLEAELGIVPFAMLPLSKEGKTVDDLTSVSTLSYVQQLCSFGGKTMELDEQACVIIADPDYDSSQSQSSFWKDLVVQLGQYLNMSDTSNTITLDKLDHSRSEADFICYFLSSHGFKVQNFLQGDANLKNMMALKHPLLIHISSHAHGTSARSPSRGDFFTDMSCGIALAGFNTYSRGLYHRILPECSVGYVPALAVSSLDLRGTKLVYLSTCNSAAGHIFTQEDVASLASAFLVAGAETVIATLWPVKDQSAAEFSKYFYDRLLNTAIRPSQALAYAKQKLSADPVWNNWIHWAGYVCYGLDNPLIP